ncbi:hypothetical protein EDC01DRAFT_633003 [Geopyxis carbonaria]|nr:hypothetical protein EDC01DRAFT_633003 [Geopyxis carbonaria]
MPHNPALHRTRTEPHLSWNGRIPPSPRPPTRPATPFRRSNSPEPPLRSSPPSFPPSLLPNLPPPVAPHHPFAPAGQIEFEARHRLERDLAAVARGARGRSPTRIELAHHEAIRGIRPLNTTQLAVLVTNERMVRDRVSDILERATGLPQAEPSMAMPLARGRTRPSPPPPSRPSPPPTSMQSQYSSPSTPSDPGTISTDLDTASSDTATTTASSDNATTTSSEQRALNDHFAGLARRSRYPLLLRRLQGIERDLERQRARYPHFTFELRRLESGVHALIERLQNATTATEVEDVDEEASAVFLAGRGWWENIGRTGGLEYQEREERGRGMSGGRSVR